MRSVFSVLRFTRIFFTYKIRHRWCRTCKRRHMYIFLYSTFDVRPRETNYFVRWRIGRVEWKRKRKEITPWSCTCKNRKDIEFIRDFVCGTVSLATRVQHERNLDDAWTFSASRHVFRFVFDMRFTIVSTAKRRISAMQEQVRASRAVLRSLIWSVLFCR